MAFQFVKKNMDETANAFHLKTFLTARESAGFPNSPQGQEEFAAIKVKSKIVT